MNLGSGPLIGGACGSGHVCVSDPRPKAGRRQGGRVRRFVVGYAYAAAALALTAANAHGGTTGGLYDMDGLLAQPHPFAAAAADPDESAAGGGENNVEFVREGLLAGKDGARNLFVGKRLREITLQSAMDLALERNLDINIALQSHSAADAARTEKDAAYDPLFSLSWSYQKTKVLQRDAYIQRLRSAKTDEDEAEIVGCVTVDGQVVDPESNSNCFTTPEVSNELEFATTTESANHVQLDLLLGALATLEVSPVANVPQSPAF